MSSGRNRANSMHVPKSDEGESPKHGTKRDNSIQPTDSAALIMATETRSNKASEKLEPDQSNNISSKNSNNDSYGKENEDGEPKEVETEEMGMAERFRLAMRDSFTN